MNTADTFPPRRVRVPAIYRGPNAAPAERTPMSEKAEILVSLLGGGVLLKLVEALLRARRGRQALTLNAAERFQKGLLDEMEREREARAEERKEHAAERRRWEAEMQECRDDRADLREMLGRLEERVSALMQRAGLVPVEKIVSSPAPAAAEEPRS